jgi:DsbC/DsbD-like thiol-disulfide interchange protein
MMQPVVNRLARASDRNQSPAMIKSLSILATATMLSTAPALAGQSSAWHHVEGGSIRLVTESEPGADGILRGALQVVLKPGWKTYWADPGESGVPPTVAVSNNGNVADPEIGFPAPSRQDDGYSQFAGYDKPVALALSFPVAEAGGALDFTAEIFLGVCQSICIPVQASLTVAPAPGPSDAIVAQAFDRLPAQPDEAFHARTVESREGKLLIEVAVPEGAHDLDLFVGSTHNRMLGPASPVAGERLLFAVPVMETGKRPGPEHTHYTLVTDQGAVSGTLEIGD